MISTVGLAVTLFATTNVDDVFVLLVFFGDPKYRVRDVILGQYLGIAALVAASYAAAVVSVAVAPAYVGLLGLLPILIGLWKLRGLLSGSEDFGNTVSTSGMGNVLAVASVTAANGGDNIGVYTPVFANSSASAMAVICTVFAIMVAVWLAFSYWLVNHPSLGAPIRRYGHVLIPFVLIGIGVYVLHESGSISLVHRASR